MAKSRTAGLEKHRKLVCVEGTKLDALTMRCPRNNTSGRKGVSFNKKHNKWEAYIKFRGKQRHLGFFDKFEKAVSARKNAEEYYYAPVLARHGRSLWTQIK